MGRDLTRLEHEVEQTRARLSANLATLREPGTYSEIADSFKQTALETRDSIVEEARNRTRSALDEMVDSVKARAAANPTAVLVIGAGIAWHLIRRPPIVTALVGGGLISLLRTPVTNGHKSDDEYLAEAKRNLGHQAEDMKRAAARTGQQAAEFAREKGAELAGQAREAIAQTAGQAREAMSHTAERTSEMAKSKAEELTAKADELSHKAREVLSDASRQATDFVREKADELRKRVGDGYDTVEHALHGENHELRAHYYGTGTAGDRGPNARYPYSAHEQGRSSTDKVLLGAAAVAIGAAFASIIARQAGDRHS